MNLSKIVVNSDGRVLIYINNKLAYSGLKTDAMVYNQFEETITVGGFIFGYKKTAVVYEIAPAVAVTLSLDFSELVDKLVSDVFTGTNASGSGGGGGGDATLAEQQAQTLELEGIQQSIGEITDAPITAPAEPNATLIGLTRGQMQKTDTLVSQTLGIGSTSDGATLDPTINASLVSVSKGLLDFAGQINASIGTGGDATVLDPDAGGSAIAILKGLLSVAGLSIGQKIDLELLPGATIVHKSGKNFDIDTATLPENVWNGGGLYTGFPITHTTTVQAVSSSASDVGVLTVLCLETETSIAYTAKTIQVNGTTPVNSAFNVYRIHSASYASTARIGTQLNVGVITVRSSANPLTVFIAMPIGRNQSYMSGYTIPAGKRGYIMGTNWRVCGVSGNQFEGAMFIRPKNGAPRYRRNITPAFAGAVSDFYDGFIVAEPGTDIMPAIVTVNANNVLAEASYDIILLPA